MSETLGAMLSHANLFSNTCSVMQALKLEPGRDRLLVVLPMFHAFAATVGLLTLAHSLGGSFDVAIAFRQQLRPSARAFLPAPGAGTGLGASADLRQ